MKKLLFIFIILLPLGLWFYYYQPFEKTENPADHIYLDAKDNIYFICQNNKYIEILRTSSSGVLTGKWKTLRYNQYNYMRLDDLIFDESGRGFCSLSGINSQNYNLTLQQWQIIDFESGKGNIIYERRFNQDDRIPPSIGVSLRKSEKGFYSLTYHRNKFLIDEFDAIGGLLSSKESSHNENINRAFLAENDRILFSNRLGEVFSLSPDNSFKKVYKDVPGAFSVFEIDGDSNIYLYDYENKIFKKSLLEDDYSTFGESSIFADGSVWTGKILSENQYAALDNFSRGANYYKNEIQGYVPVPTYFEWEGLAIAVGISVFLFIFYFLVLYLVKKWKLTVSLLLKQAIIILFIIGGGVFALSFWLKDTLISMYEEDVIFALRKTVHKYQNLYNTNEFWDIDLYSPEKNPLLSSITETYAYYVGETELKKLLPDGGLESTFISENHYTEIMFLRDGQWRTVHYDDAYINLPIDQVVGRENAEFYNRLIGDISYDGLIIGLDTIDTNFIAVLMPVYDSKGKMAALIETGISKRQYIYETEETIRTLLMYTGGVMLIVVAILLMALGISLFSLKRLRRGVLDLGKGNYRQLPIRGNDEITAISQAFNEMSRQIENNTKHLEEINKSYFRFLPLELLQNLGQESILEVNCGDCADINTYIFYISLINFYEICEKMNSNETFSFYNRICGDITKLIMIHNGIVESCNQSEFICLFDKGDNALKAAVEINKKLNEFNQYQIKKLKTVSALVKGTALIGVAGNEKRLETITISRCIELSRRIAEIGAIYGVRIIYPENDIIGNFSRILGTFSHDGEKIRLFDCYEGDESDSFFSKKRLSNLFEKGVVAFESGKYEEAKTVFIKYLRESVPCQAVKQYLFLSEHNIINPKDILALGDSVDL